jgi:ribosomal protein L30/L7E
MRCKASPPRASGPHRPTPGALRALRLREVHHAVGGSGGA